jgi:hypothetical protein
VNKVASEPNGFGSKEWAKEFGSSHRTRVAGVNGADEEASTLATEDGSAVLDVGCIRSPKVDVPCGALTVTPSLVAVASA